MNIGILDLLTVSARNPLDYADCFVVRKQYASLTPQAIAVWCRQLGHRVHYATYFGFGDPKARLPSDLDVVFISAHTPRAPLAYALSKLYRLERTRTVIGGPHAKAYPQDCLRYFDLVVLECDKDLIANIIGNHFEPKSVISSPRPYEEVPLLEERVAEVRASTFLMGRPYPGSSIPMLASMGCPYTCNFCTDWNNPYRPLSNERLLTDLRYASKTFPGTMLAFDDPNFGVRFDEMMAVFEMVPKGQRSPYGIESSLSNMRPGRLQRLQDTNCFAVAPGVESWTDYSNKAGVGKAAGHDKLEQVIVHFHTLHEHIPYLQANFIFGLDTDAGDDPFELTKEFVRRTPFVWTYINIPFAFGGTPLYSDFLSQGRILTKMPFSFYILPYLTLVLKHYDPVTYYQKMFDLYSLVTSGEMLRQRFASVRHPFAKYLDYIRTLFTRPITRQLRTILRQLETDKGFYAFHTGESQVLPDFYIGLYKEQLGRYVELVPIEDSQPVLAPEAARSLLINPVFSS
jgi:radical SAM superfamily enzyme YgiQ (UPF0313 family)